MFRQSDVMSRPVQWKIILLQLNDRRRQWLQRHRKKCYSLPVALFVVVLLWTMYNQLSNWDGIVMPIAVISDTPPDNQIGEYSKLWLEFGYNAWLAERIPLRRWLPDMRDERCLNDTNPYLSTNVGAVSIIVIFRNEQLAMLLRTLHSIRDRTDESAFGELLLIDDCSDTHFWQEKLSQQAFKEYVQSYIHAEARIFHVEEQVGLIRARRLAAVEAREDNLVFLDAHVEVTDGWLEPLLTVINENRYTLAVPQLDRLDEKTLEYVRVVERRSLFDWSLRRREVPLLWQQLKQLPQPFATAIARTSAFAIDAKWFHDLIHLNTQLNAPAAAELELSFKVWRSGGRVRQVPCSRVGHLQPSDLNYLQRYGNLSQMATQHFTSLKRLTEIWLSEPKYKSLVYEYQPQIQLSQIGNISATQQLIKNSSFKSFDWYLEHVSTDLLVHFPMNPRIDNAHGSLRPAQVPTHCLTGDLSTLRVILQPCLPHQTPVQNWTLTYMNDLRLGDNICAEVQRTQSVALNGCHTFGGRQRWHFDKDYNSLVSNNHCLEITVQLKVLVRPCNFRNTYQMWFFKHAILEPKAGK